MRKLYYIETTLNGYVIEKTEICDYTTNKDYIEDLIFQREGEEVNYYDEITGDMDELDAFLKLGNNRHCGDYNHSYGDKANVYREHWLTDSLGYYTDRFIGLMVE